MRLIMALLALGLLGGRANADGIAKRYTLYNSMDDFSYLGMLSKRDECSDAFGSNAQNSICVPDSTLCCTYDDHATELPGLHGRLTLS